ncbi:S1 RNA-binding domain-containing protein [Clostridium chromiireducens]|uniref:S1 RNA-binding domain-containing protein n=1 Tax=Clostridium chromiireducens TaxID=225345 RepID=A0A399IPH8_9CLOT|nr:S1-like domain-containing RNA-binding protein [Clostridium chromiireducens]MVX64118.1 S1 RNA-binding domain-containing protein [Clostridium chromiireducens]RII34948.1 S1 RNA-binding domain-containing protein [Clostridium chromiireducens]
MITIGEYNKLKVSKKVDFGYYLEDNFGDEVLLPNSAAKGHEIKEGDNLEVFIYRDSKDRLISTLKKPLLTVGQIGYLEVVSQNNIGAFVNFGLERDLFVPLKEQGYKLKEGKKYLFYMYVDKTDRLAATTRIHPYLDLAEEGKYKVSDEVDVIVYETNENGTLNVAVDGEYRGLILATEHFDFIYPGQQIKARVKRIYEDGTIGITTRKRRLEARSELSETILKYLKENGGFMPYNDKSAPEDIKKEFNTSKNYFKMTLGGLMKEKLITQDKEGTRLL